MNKYEVTIPKINSDKRIIEAPNAGKAKYWAYMAIKSYWPNIKLIDVKAKLCA